ncbi:MAG: polyketide synthase module [Rhodanobacteraceae bacterium]|jgi:amino acid adenylation domain-containing protein|nr:MAG: polyketide synthase module [Rhodanobacteraceae bacterium]
MTQGDPRTTAATNEFDPFAQPALARVVPALEAQREVWLAAKLVPEASLAYNEAVSLKLSGALDVTALRAALDAVVARHDALRATLGTDGAEVCIAEHVDLPLRERDLSALSPADRASEIATAERMVVETPFDLEHGPLLRAELLKLGGDQHLLLLSAHHIVCDGWSWGVIVHDLGEAYRAAHTHSAPDLAAADSFADFAVAEARYAQSDDFRAAERYWLSRYATLPTPLDLPTDHPRPRFRGFASQRCDLHLEPADVRAAAQCAARHGASLYALLLAAFAALLHRFSGQDDLVIGVPAAGQAGGHEQMVGHAVNILPVRLPVTDAMPFQQFLADVRGQLLDAFEHQRYTFGTLLTRLAMPRDPSRLPLVSVLFNLDRAFGPDQADFGDLQFEFASVPRSFENFELFINAVQRGDGGLSLECQFNSGLYDSGTIEAWLDAYVTLLRGIVEDATLAVGRVPLLSAAQAAWLESLQPARTPYEAGRLAHEYFERQADRTPQNAAVRDAQVRWTYAELEARANRIAHVLRARGVGRGALVGICLERNADMLAVVLGTLKTGAGYVPLDPAYPAERLAFMVADAELAALVVSDSVPANVAFPVERTLSLARDSEELAKASAARLARDPGTDPSRDVAYVIFTSGSTGKPKGVLVPHQAASNLLTSLQREPGIRAEDRLVAVTTLSFDIAFMELLLPLCVGAEIVIAGRDEVRDGAALRGLIERSEATLLQATPSGWRILLDSGWRGHPGFRAVSGGEPLSVDLAEALLERCGEVWNGYGPTEATVYSTFWRVTNPRAGIYIGSPVANSSVRVLDAQGLPCPLGVPGELYIGGDGVALGYLHRPELDAERFLPDPDATIAGARRYRTGDRGRWTARGWIEHLGRLDFQIKLRGYRIEPGEIEANLVEAPGVARAVVIVREDRPGDQRLVAYVTGRDNIGPDEASLRTWLHGRLPEYMVPQHFVVLDAIPLLPNGKTDRKSLPAPQAQLSSGREYVAPRDEREARVAEAMEQTLALPGIGIHDDFFALGGHSLLAAQLTARLNREFGITLSLRTLFDSPTIAGLAAAIGEQLAKGDASAPEHIARRADRTRAPASLMQQRLWFLEEMNPGRVAYNTPSAHRLRGHLDESAFERAFAAMVERQAVLRTSLRREGDQVLQIVEPAVDVKLFPAEDLSGLPEQVRESELMRRLQVLTDIPFDLTRAPLFRAHMFKLGEDDHAFFFMPHHIIWDGWSFDLMYTELATSYRAIKAGQPAGLPELPVSYGDFSEWHWRWLEGPQLQSQLAFWRERLKNSGEPKNLPTDRPRRPGMSGVGRTEWIRVSRETTEAMREAARAADATLNMGLLALYYILLYGTTGQRDLVVGTPVRGRNQVEVESVMGYFTNLVPLHLALDPALSFVDFLREVKRMVVDSFGNPDVPLEYLQRELRARYGGSAPLYQALFSFQDARQRITDWGGLSHEQILLFQSGATEDLGLWFLENAKGMIGGVTYNADILDADTVRMQRARYLELLVRVIEDPHQSIAALTQKMRNPQEGRQAATAAAVPVQPSQPPAGDGAGAAATVKPVAEQSAVSPTPASQPIGALERALMEIWCEVLQVREIGIHADFFDLGGDSLLAVRMFHLAQKLTGVNLPLATLLTAPTIARQAAAFRAAGAKEPETTGSAIFVDDSVRDPWAPLVPIQPRGSRPPLFCIHAVGGNVLNYVPVAKALGEEQPFYGIQAIGLNGLTPPLDSLTEMATRYLAEIRTVQPHGPYFLAGGSMGGMIAYEIARQMRSQGETIGLLAMFDTYGPSNRQFEVSGRWEKRLARARGLDLQGKLGMLAHALAWRIRHVADIVRIRWFRLRRKTIPHDLRYREIERVHERAYMGYTAVSSDIPVTLFRASEQCEGVTTSRALGWEETVSGKIEVIDMPGGHDNLVEQPKLVENLREVLARAQAAQGH